MNYLGRSLVCGCASVALVGAVSPAFGGIGVFTTTIDVPPNLGDFTSIGADTQVNVNGGSIGNSSSITGGAAASDRSELNIDLGGSVGNFFEATNTDINLLDGSIGFSFTANTSTVTIDGGSIGNDFNANTGSTVTLNGGAIGDSFNSQANGNSVVNINGGSVGTFFDVNDGDVLNLNGGVIGDSFDIDEGGLVNFRGGSIGQVGDGNVEVAGSLYIFGTEFFIDGELLDFGGEDELVLVDFNADPQIGVPPSGVLTGTLEFDGVLNLDLNEGSTFDFNGDTGRLVLHLIPEPGSLALLAVGSVLIAARRRRHG